MTKKDQSGLQCGQFDALLSDALDGLLTGERLEAFEAHSHECPACGPLWSSAYYRGKSRVRRYRPVPRVANVTSD